MVLTVDIEDNSGNKQHVYYTKAMYENPLNGTRYFDVLIDGNSIDKRTDFQVGFIVYFYWSGTLELKGKILKTSNTSTGEMRLEGTGYGERILSQPKTAEQGFTATTTTGVVSSGTNNLLSFVNGITAGTIENQTVNDFRTYTAQNVLEATAKLTELTDQDWSIDDANDEVDVLNHQGSSSSIGTLTDGKDTYNISKEENETDKLTKITVIGKGYGAEQISGIWGAGGLNAPSHSAGDNEESIIDKSLTTTTQCQNLAEKTYNVLSASRFSYKFNVINPYYTHVLGDVVTLDAPNVGIDTTNLRIVLVKRVATTKDSMLMWEVRATTEREASEDVLSHEQALARAYREAVSFTQPTDTATSNVSITGGVTAGPSDTSITGGVTSGASVTSITGSVLTAGSGETGYAVGSYQNSVTDDATWRSVGTSINTASKVTYMWHSVFASVFMNGQSHPYVQIRLKNTTNTEYFPSTTGIYLNGASGTPGVDLWISFSGGIIVPKQWVNKNVILQYEVGEVLYGGANIEYSYYGVQGHIHSDSIDTSDADHGHVDSIDTSDAGHHN